MTEFEKNQLAIQLTDIWLRHRTAILTANAAATDTPVAKNDEMELDAVLNQFHVVRGWVATYVK
jgi:hypothetical protein